MRIKTGLVTAAAALAVSTGVTSSLGATASLTQIGALTPSASDGGVMSSKVNALSPDGTWAVGSSTGHNLADTSSMPQPIIWSASTSLNQIPNPNDQANHAHGVAYNSSGNLVVAGYDFDSVAGAYRLASYTTSPATPTAGSWLVHGQHGPLVAEYNAARSWNSNADVVIAGRRSSRSSAMAAYVTGGSYTEYRSGTTTPPAPYMMTSTSRVLYGSSYAFGVGWDSGNPSSRHRAMKMGTPNGTNSIPLQDNGYQSETLGLTPDATTTSGVAVGFDQDSTGANLPHAAVWDMSLPAASSRSFLSELAGDNQSTAIDIRLIGGNRIIGGFSSDGTTEHAVLWDSTGTWDATGAPQLLSSLLTGLGVDVSGWSSLSRVTTMSDDGKTVAGWGIWAADNTTRGFVATVPEPASLLLLTLGAMPLLRRRRR